MREPQLNRGIDDFLVFVACDAAVDFRIFAALVEGGVLAHKAYQKMPLREVVVNPVEQADGIVFVFRKNDFRSLSSVQSAQGASASHKDHIYPPQSFSTNRSRHPPGIES